MIDVLWFLLLLAAAGDNEYKFDVRDDADRAAIIETQQDPKMARVKLLFSNTASGRTYHMAVKDFFKITGVGDVWIDSLEASGKDAGLSTKLLHRFDCAQRTFTILSYVIYNKDGSIKDSASSSIYKTATTPIVPDTIGETTLIAACRDAR